MKTLATLVLLLSLPHVPLPAPPRTPVDRLTQRVHRGGRWHWAANGHAVYCYGPVRTLPQARGGLQRVATYCQGERPLVPLKD